MPALFLIELSFFKVVLQVANICCDPDGNICTSPVLLRTDWQVENCHNSWLLNVNFIWHQALELLRQRIYITEKIWKLILFRYLINYLWIVIKFFLNIFMWKKLVSETRVCLLQASNQLVYNFWVQLLLLYQKLQTRTHLSAYDPGGGGGTKNYKPGRIYLRRILGGGGDGGCIPLQYRCNEEGVIFIPPASTKLVPTSVLQPVSISRFITRVCCVDKKRPIVELFTARF